MPTFYTDLWPQRGADRLASYICHIDFFNSSRCNLLDKQIVDAVSGTGETVIEIRSKHQVTAIGTEIEVFGIDIQRHIFSGLEIVDVDHRATSGGAVKIEEGNVPSIGTNGSWRAALEQSICDRTIVARSQGCACPGRNSGFPVMNEGIVICVVY